ncbi:MAG: DUF4340 domain-containing protein [Chloroflexota bacterium]|nr:DUF4340 domain-containing protein [Chloroflexota bacterium]MDQ5864214.1 DUF4340 domain-containing protein [Chloroflexota bacterium]
MERYRTTIIMLVLLVVLGGLAVALGGNRGTTTPGEPTPEPVTYVWEDQNPVIGLEAVSGTQRLLITKDVTTTIWSIREPISDTAEPFAVGGLADQLQSLQASGTITEAGDLAQFGLAQPDITATITYSDAAGTKRTLLVGDPTIDGSAYYVKTPDSTEVYLVSNAVIQPLQSWFSNPPKALPTATPLLPTLAPTQEVTATGTITGTVLPAGTTAPSGTGTPQSGGTPSPAVQATGTISGTGTITPQEPGAVNATTPETTPLLATATPPGAAASPTP